MATIRKEISIEAPPEEVWAALREFQALDRLAPGFITASRPDGDDRVVTFFNGTELREVLVGLDDDLRRLAWTIVDGPYSHHNGAAQVLAAEGGGATFVWTADLLPDEAAEGTGLMMVKGLGVMKETLEKNRGND